MALTIALETTIGFMRGRPPRQLPRPCGGLEQRNDAVREFTNGIADQQVPVKVFRNGQVVTQQVTLGAR
jgi:hypothetical protein